MTKILLSSFILLCLLSTINAQTPATAGSGGFNYSSFTEEKKIITPELQSLTDKQFYDHPEFGVLPFNAPCADCIELLQKRDETHRYFVKNGTQGKEFYQQSSYGGLSYKEQGVLRTIDPRLRPSEQQGVFRADRQPFAVTINLPFPPSGGRGAFTSILNAGKELQVNRDVAIYIRHKDGSITSLGEPDWSHYTVGDNGMVIHNFYPGIDLEMRLGTGNIESFYRLNRPLNLTDGWLVIRDNMKVPEGLVYDYSNSIKKEGNNYEGTLFINNKEGVHYFYIGTPAAYDENNEHDNAVNLNYRITDNGAYDLYIPVDWMNDANRSYPLIIDPFVTATSTLPQASITGSGYSDTCFKNGCAYDLNVAVPACCVVTSMTYSFNYRALGSCNLNQGAWDLTWGACRSPQTGYWHTCTIGLPGLCILQNLSCFADFDSCLIPQCAAYNIPMVLTFYRCVQPGAQCSFSCVNAETPWDMTVTGRTVEIGTPVSSAGNGTVCIGGIDTLTANATWGVPPYSFTWYPGDLTGNPVIVSPDITTTYTVRVSTCCGTDSDSATVTIVVDSCTGIIESYLSNLFSVYPNPSQGSFTIQSDFIKSDHVDMDIYNVMGEKVYSFVIREEDIKKGYQLRLNSSSGLYLLVLRADDAVMGKKISVLK